MKWHYIMDSQPKTGSYIICIENSPKYFDIGLRYYQESEPFKQIIEYNNKHCLENPDFWWVYARDFPWPAKRTTVVDCRIDHEM